MKRVLLVSNDYVGPAMAGPGIRYYNFARELAERFDVTLMVPNEANEAVVKGVEVVTAPRARRSRRRVFRGYDVIVAQRLGAREMRDAARMDTRLIFDLYDPLMMENLPLFALGGSAEATAYRVSNLGQKIALATGDAFVCASERQRDLWLGALSALGRIDVARYRDDPNLRNLIDVVAFGLEAEPPKRTRRALKGVVPGIREHDKVLVWGGGIWPWVDADVVIRAVSEISRTRDDVKLFFLGLARPNPESAHDSAARRAVETATELGVFGKSVFFNEGWVPYDDRHNFLLDADLGVSAHFDTVETRFAFRTRLLDYFWAGLPSVVTRGDVLGELVDKRNLGRVVGPDDVGGWVTAITELLDDHDEYRRIEANIERVRDEFTWRQVTEPLARLVAGERTDARAKPSAMPLVVGDLALRAQLSLVKRGAIGSLGRLGEIVGAKARRAVARPSNESAPRRLG